MEGHRLLELPGATNMNRPIFVLIAGVTASLPTLGGPSDGFIALNQSIAILADSPQSKELSDQLYTLRDLTKKLEDRFVANGLSMPTDFQKTLDFDADQLRFAATGKGEVPAKVLLNEVVEDLRAKDRGTQKGAAAGSFAFPTHIRVIVTTKNGTSKVDGYIVQCNPRRYANSAQAMFTFAQLSSPTSTQLPAGMYACTASQGTIVKGLQTVPAGLDGNLQIEVDIPVQ